MICKALAAALCTGFFIWGPSAHAAVATDAPLDGLLAFKRPQSCTEAPALAQLIKSALTPEARGQGDGFRLGRLEVPAQYRAQVGSPSLTRSPDKAYLVRIPLRGTWRGLRVLDLAIYAYAESEGGYGITFDARRDVVLKVANDAGFALDAKGVRHIDDGVTKTTIAISEAGGHSTLTCSIG